MSCNFAQNKGKRGERAAVKALQPTIDEVYKDSHIDTPMLFRNGNQAAGGGYDIDGISWMALEIKNCETFQFNKWWDQAKSQATDLQVPVLMYKKNHVKWRIRMVGYLPCGPKRIKTVVDISLEQFLVWFKTVLTDQLAYLETNGGG